MDEIIEEELKSFEKYKELIALYKKLDNADYIWKKYIYRRGIDMLYYIYCKDIQNQHFYVNFEEKQFILINIFSDEAEYYPLNEYGKTWALTREELE